MKSRFRSLDEAVEEINQLRGHIEPKSEAEPAPEPESRFWSYTSKQGIGQEIIPGNEAAEHHVADHELKSDRGIHYQKCRGGRRVIRKRIGGE